MRGSSSHFEDEEPSSRSIEAHELPVLIQAWSEALTADNNGRRDVPVQLQRYLDANPDDQQQMMRELYMFLHAQQLVAMTSRMDQMARDQRVCTRHLKKLVSEKPEPTARWWGLGWSGLISLGLSGAALALTLWTTRAAR